MTVLVAKYQKPETFVPGAIVGFCGLIEWASWLVIIILIVDRWELIHRASLGVLVGLVSNILLNLANLFFYKRNMYLDPEF